MIHVLLSYDIVDNRRRTRLAKALSNYLERVQKSVFEGKVPDRRWGDLQEAIEREIDPSEDSVRIYRLCVRCQLSIEVLGLGSYVETEGDEII